jgi:hypothetical protein
VGINHRHDYHTHVSFHCCDDVIDTNYNYYDQFQIQATMPPSRHSKRKAGSQAVVNGAAGPLFPDVPSEEKKAKRVKRSVITAANNGEKKVKKIKRPAVTTDDDGDDDDIDIDDATDNVTRLCKNCGRIWNYPGFICKHLDCGMRCDQEFESAQNVYIRAVRQSQSGASPSPAAAASYQGTSTAASTPTKDSLDKFDRYCLMNTNKGAPYPVFESGYSCTVDQGRTIMSKTYLASTYVKPSTHLVALIRSGKMTHVGEAVPRTILAAEEAQMHDGSGVLISFVDGQPHTTQPMKGTHAQSYDHFLAALHFTILPSLIEQKQVLMDWLALAVTIAELNKSLGWVSANNYLIRHLNDKVNARERFGAVDHDIISELATSRMAAAMSSATRAPPSSSSSSSPSAHSSSSESYGASSSRGVRPCVGYNFVADGCKNGTLCNFKHDCQFRPKCANPEVHKATACEIYNPDHPSNLKRTVTNDLAKPPFKGKAPSHPKRK